MDKTNVNKSGTSSWNVSKIKSGNKRFVRKNAHGAKSRRPVATSDWSWESLDVFPTEFNRPSAFHDNRSSPDKYKKKAWSDVQSTGSHKQRKLTAFQKAKDSMKQRQEAAVLQKSEAQAKKQANLNKKLENIEQRKLSFREHCKRHKFGQPVMASRMKMLLEKIQKTSISGPES